MVYLCGAIQTIYEYGQLQFKRFVEAQDSGWSGYAQALKEIRGGRKMSHWIWYVFPQMKGLGRSYNSNYYGIMSLAEAEACLAHELLGQRLREISSALLSVEGKTAQEILGKPDDMKVCSCMTLFDLVAPDDVFAEVLNKYYDGKRCRRTLRMLENTR